MSSHRTLLLALSFMTLAGQNLRAEVVMTARIQSNDYAVREPLEIKVEIANLTADTVRPPTDVEKTILDAFWCADRSDLAMGDDTAYITIDEDRTRRTLAQYPEHPLADYLRLNLARGLMKPGDHIDDEIVALLEVLRPKREFRWEETHGLLGGAYSIRGDDERAMEVLYEAIEASPRLLHNDAYMRRVIQTSSKSTDSVVQWEIECANGERMRFAGIPIPESLLKASQEEE